MNAVVVPCGFHPGSFISLFKQNINFLLKSKIATEEKVRKGFLGGFRMKKSQRRRRTIDKACWEFQNPEKSPRTHNKHTNDLDDDDTLRTEELVLRRTLDLFHFNEIFFLLFFYSSKSYINYISINGRLEFNQPISHERV
jgi:hypothetical protein